MVRYIPYSLEYSHLYFSKKLYLSRLSQGTRPERSKFIRYILTRLTIIFCSLQQCYAEPFFNDHARGWHWYEPLPIFEDSMEEEQKEEKTREKIPPQSKTPSDLIKAYREELEARLHKAWIYPSPQNIKSYQEMQKDLMNRSKIFATVWMQNVFQNPDLDHTLISPVNQQARHLQIDLEKERTRKVIEQLSQTYGLFFFFSSNCPYCHQFAPIVKRFAESYSWKVIAISVDGGKLKEFPDAQADNGLFEIWGLKALPALFAINPNIKEAIPIAYGLTSLDEMENRVMRLLEAQS